LSISVTLSSSIFSFSRLSWANEVISTEATIFHTINKIADWFEEVIRDHNLYNEVVDPDWDVLLNDVKQKTYFKINTITEEIESYVYQPNITQKKIKKYLIEQLENYREWFNRFNKKYFFHIIFLHCSLHVYIT
jgi:hypothetical protein